MIATFMLTQTVSAFDALKVQVKRFCSRLQGTACVVGSGAAGRLMTRRYGSSRLSWPCAQQKAWARCCGRYIAARLEKAVW
jgi:hypothetical protein